MAMLLRIRPTLSVGMMILTTIIVIIVIEQLLTPPKAAGNPPVLRLGKRRINLNLLAVHLIGLKDNEGLRLLINYAESNGQEGEMDLFQIFQSEGVPDPAARQIGDFLLNSHVKMIVIESLHIIADAYGRAYRDADATAIERLTTDSDQGIRRTAILALERIEWYRKHAKEEPPNGRQERCLSP